MQTKKRLVRLLFLTAILLQTAFIFGNSLASVEESVSISGGVTAFLKGLLDPNGRIDDELFHHLVRKTAHFTEFFVLSALYTLFRSLLSQPLQDKLFLLAPFAGILTAVCDEFIQSFTGRGSAVKDVVLDFCGVLTAFAFVSVCLFLLDKQRKDISKGEKPS